MSTVQFNLLPDVKMTYVKAQRSHKLIISACVLVSAAAIGVLVLLFTSVILVQKKQLGDADKEIEKYTQQLQSIDGVDEALTAQSQLNSLSSLHKDKHISSRLFNYLTQITLPNVSFTKINLDFSTNKLVIGGETDVQYTVNRLIDTMRFTEYKLGQQETDGNVAFSNVTESSFTIEDDGLTFEITADFNPELFANNATDENGKPITPILVVPSLTTTHAQSGSLPQDSNTGGQQ